MFQKATVPPAPPPPQARPQPQPQKQTIDLDEKTLNYYLNGLADNSAKKRERTIREFESIYSHDQRVLTSVRFLASNDPQLYVREAALRLIAKKDNPQYANAAQQAVATIHTARRKGANRNIGCGLILLTFGVLASLASYANASPGGSYLIFGGAMLFGFFWLLDGLSKR
jgi:hypothetical protein